MTNPRVCPSVVRIHPVSPLFSVDFRQQSTTLFLMTKTFIDPEEKCRDIGYFSRRATVFHSLTGKLVNCRATIPDTFFSIPATTATEHGYITGRDDGELEFRPHTDQEDENPVEFRKNYRKNCK